VTTTGATGTTKEREAGTRRGRTATCGSTTFALWHSLLVIKRLVPGAGHRLLLRQWGRFAAEATVAGGGHRFDFYMDGDAARAEEAVVPLMDSSIDGLAALSRVGINGGPDLVQLGLGVGPGR
jgi:hypothetical protein